MFSLNLSKSFIKRYGKISKNNKSIDTKIATILKKIQLNPFDQGLRSHKVITKTGDVSWSSRITGDLRIIWNFHFNSSDEIDILDIGGHSGKKKVY